MEKSHAATGRILAVQEDRFRLMTDEGETLLLTLPRFGRTGAADLRRWHETGAHVRVVYSGEPDLASGAARSVTPLANGKA